MGASNGYTLAGARCHPIRSRAATGLSAPSWVTIVSDANRLIPMSKQHHRLLRSRRWAAVRREVLDRDGWRCTSCGRAGRLEVDHREPLGEGGAPYDLSNLQTLCRSCHVAKTRLERRGEDPEEVVAWRALVAELSTDS